ncbi:unnamed protein product [Cyprideis torosa]|uniref:RNA polymerase II-associated protein 3 n=1 Tax=Cyprideis torosa TaxID=163714 RepID=A0A7R8WED9_9CRUS|nr:unnamed protein product [Cyprideis torosa]CAG0892791.1 unnamed protein product [Cyprideis torosa]
MQRQLKENSEELQDFLRSMKQWEEELREKDQKIIQEKKMKAKASTSLADVPPPLEYNVKKADKEQNGATSEIQNVSSVKEFHREFLAGPSAGDKTSDKQRFFERQQASEAKEKGNILFRQGKFTEAVATYSHGISLDPRNPVLLGNRAQGWLKLKKYRSAIEDCTHALALDPKFVKALYRRGLAYHSLKEYQEAVNDFNAILSLDPGNVQAWQSLKRAESELAKVGQLRLNKSSLTKEEVVKERSIQPISKPLNLRSKVPLRRIPIEIISPAALDDGTQQGIVTDLPLREAKTVYKPYIQELATTETPTPVTTGSVQLNDEVSTESQQDFFDDNNPHQNHQDNTLSESKESKDDSLKESTNDVPEDSKKIIVSQAEPKEQLILGSSSDAKKLRLSPSEEVATSNSEKPPGDDVVVPAVPKSFAYFESTWPTLSAEQKVLYLKNLNSANASKSMTSFFAGFLDAELLSSLIQTLTRFPSGSLEDVASIIEALSKCSRLSLVTFGLNDDDRQKLRQLCSQCSLESNVIERFGI